MQDNSQKEALVCKSKRMAKTYIIEELLVSSLSSYSRAGKIKFADNYIDGID